MTTKDFKKSRSDIPKTPGVYQFLSKSGTTLYVGKAKNLRNRLSSYFNNQSSLAIKTRRMLKNAHSIRFTLVETEQDALLLENTLIKELQPRYNVMLKDGKSYSYLCIKNERFPRVYLTRKVVRDGSTYFGPYTSRNRTKQLLELIKQLFPLRTCKYSLSEKNIERNKIKLCLEYHIHNCLGPCERLQTEENYMDNIRQIKNILKGNFAPVKDYINERMQECAAELRFEQAQKWKEKLQLFEDYRSKSTVVSTQIKDVDVFSYVDTEETAFVNYLKVVRGVLLNIHTIRLEKNLNEDRDSILYFAIKNMRERYNSVATELVLERKIDWPDDKTTLTIPRRGDKKKLLDLSKKNAEYMLHQHQRELLNKKARVRSSERILKTLQLDLRMDKIPYHIECFDNSNLQGTNPVASCVVFKNAQPYKRAYRHYHVKTVSGPDDFASMREIIYRRYSRLLREGAPLPQLIIIDGGKGQLSAAVSGLEQLDILKKVSLIGIAKKLEEIFFPGDSIPLYINKKSESLKLIQRARNEAHRFALSFHQKMRTKNMITSQLTEIPGVGEKTAQKLLSRFGSLAEIKKQDVNQIATEVGKAMALKIFNALK